MNHFAFARVPAIALIGTLAVGFAVGGCSKSASKSSSTVPTSVAPSSTSSPTTLAATTTTPPTRTGADDLEGYFAAVANDDRLLKAAAAAVNAAIGRTQITVAQSTLDAIEAANPAAAAQEIPPGLTPSVLLPVLTVQSDLVSRYFSLRGVRIYLTVDGRPRAVPVSDPQVRDALGCLGEGAPAAAALANDVAAARAAATGQPPVATVGPTSRAAAELAVRLAYTVEANSGSLGCGGTRVLSLVPITWQSAPPVVGDTASWSGQVAGVALTATYTAGQGWTIQIHAN